MAVTIKSPREIELMKKAGEILAKTHDELAKALQPGHVHHGHRQARRKDHPRLRLHPFL